ncbi:MAG: RNA-binding transcriptional accessory protein [Deltaproteobacteria bacterium]|nr:RNA-binding transcriptional accessory protein [Deltaproteobacteria bacterium]
MNQDHLDSISREMGLQPYQVRATAALLEEGATVPFIARYRKEATGTLDETLVAAIRDRLAQLDVLEKRRSAVLKSLREREKLTDQLEESILLAATLAEIEDIYLPFRPKRRTRAAIAREKGLEQLALALFEQDPAVDPMELAQGFISPEKEVVSAEDALSGARDIIAEWVNENADSRLKLRAFFFSKGMLRSRVVPGKEAEGIQYRDYYEKEEPIAGAPSHRILAVRRGEKEGFLTVRIEPPEKEALGILESVFVKNDSASSVHVRTAVHDGYKRLLGPSLETEIKNESKLRADKEAIQVFADNLRPLLMAPPLGFKKVIAIDPGFRTGCKLVCLDPQGKLIHTETIYPHTGAESSEKAAERIRVLARDFSTEAIAIGNGTAGRETESFIRKLGLPQEIQVIMVDESGASIYSASNVAREEFPDYDLTVRGAVSIGRRLIDPLAELVKIDPKSIGVGQYQHDVDQAELKKGLDDVVVSCVNAVGVEVNSASPQLLSYISGLGPQLASNIVSHREENGPFRKRDELKKVVRLGARAFEQSAGFLRISGGENPLDASAVHPESYPIVEKMAGDLGCSVADLMREASFREKIDPARYVTEKAGIPTLVDILSELAKPGRDPRKSFEAFSFAAGVEKLTDLHPGMKLPGIVTNVTAFGAFVDIGVHRDGLVHVSELSDRFVKDPRQVVKVHQKVSVTILEVDLERGRVSLSMKSGIAAAAGTGEADTTDRPPGRSEKAAPSAPGPQRAKTPVANRKTAFNNPFEKAFKKRD